MKPWLWPDHDIGKREGRALREEHNAAVEEHRSALALLSRLLTHLEREGVENIDTREARTVVTT